MRLAAVALILLAAHVAEATPPEPTGAHPRMLLDAELKAAWSVAATQERGPIAGSLALCTSGGTTGEHDRAVYMGSEWSRVLQACLVAYAATGKQEHATTAIKFFTALLDDLDMIGDDKGGDAAARRDSGYALRNLGPSTALAYDWLYPRLSPELRSRARQRWAAWLTWYRDKGYRARQAGTNYQAGYLASATMVAIAQGGEASENGATLWKFVADELWGKDMATALAPGGILDGGDWPEGWQYGPLAVANYALAARVAVRAGIPVDGIARWLGATLRRHIYGLSPDDRVYVGQDSEADTPNVAPNVLTLAAIAIGDATPDDRKWARGELARLQITDKDYFLYDALAAAPATAALAPRSTWPTLYTAPATSTIFARTRWDAKAVWFVAECAAALPVDHRQPKAGNFVLSRGTDDVIVDPSPYGSASTLTSNAPTVVSAHMPADYKPSQGAWGRGTAWQFIAQTRSGVLAARCDYAGAYQMQEQRTDIASATRDFVLLPNADGTDAALVVIDRASTGAADRGMNLRFHVVGGLTLAADTAEKLLGSTKLTIAAASRSSGTAVVARPSAKDCFAAGVSKGKCDAARFAASAYLVELAGPSPSAVHVLGVTGQGAPAVTQAPINGDGYAGVQLTGARTASVIWPLRFARGAFIYRAPAGTHVLLDVVDADHASITAKRDGNACAVSVMPGGPIPARPAVIILDARCALTVDRATATAATAAQTHARTPRRSSPRAARGGCCDASVSPSSSLSLALVTLAMMRRKRRR